MRAQVIFLLIFLLGAASIAVAKTPLYLVVVPDDCSLNEVGWGYKENPVIVPGRKWKIGDSSGCAVEIDRREYERRFGFCFLSGVKYERGSGSCGVKYYDDKDKYIFEISPVDSWDFECVFSCMKLE